MEHRCCIEFLNIKGKLVFDGSIENLDCIISMRSIKPSRTRLCLRMQESIAPTPIWSHTQLVRDFQFTGVRKKNQNIMN